MSWKPLAPKLSDTPDSTGLSDHQKTALITAWSMINDNLYEHSKNIFAKFYDQNTEYLALFYTLGNDFMHQHTEDVLQIFNEMIVVGLRDVEIFDENLKKIEKSHKYLSRSDVKKLNDVIKSYFLEKVARNKTKTLEDAVNLLMVKIESRFDELAEGKNDEDDKENRHDDQEEIESLKSLVEKETEQVDQKESEHSNLESSVKEI
jgi:Globin